MTKLKAVLFDLDGTLLYTLPDIHLCLNRTLEAHGYAPCTASQTRSYIGGGVRQLLERAVGKDAQDLDALCTEYGALYPLHAQDHVEFYPGIPELVEALRGRGLLTGVVTNKPHAAAVAMIERFCGKSMDVTIGKREGCPAKPAPDSLLEAVEALGLAPEEVLYVGDAPVDAETARNGALPCVLVSWGYSDREVLEGCEALALIDAPAALLSLFPEN